MGLASSSFTSNVQTSTTNLLLNNLDVAGMSATEIIRWGLEHAENPVISTNFRPGAAALLHRVIAERADIPVIWVDTGYNTATTYRYVEQLRREWRLNLYCYTPLVSAARFQAINGDLPQPDAAEFTRFVRDVKLEPFERAFNELKPDLWFTGIRGEQNELRQSLGVISRGLHNTLRVAPLHNESEADIARYLATYGIADNSDYIDPTKPNAHLECGLQLLA